MAESRDGPAPMTEAELQNAVVDIGAPVRLAVRPFRSVRIQRHDETDRYATPVSADGAGWPDLVLVRDHRILFRELKSDRGVLSVEQQDGSTPSSAPGPTWTCGGPRIGPTAPSRWHSR